MSRTFVHTPYRVKMRQWHWRDHFTEVHRHNGHPCDLDRFLTAGVAGRTRCYIQPVWLGRQVFCSCDGCSGHLKGRRRLHQATRTGWRADARTILKASPGDRDTPGPPPHRSSW